jgi:hypothetical protein
MQRLEDTPIPVRIKLAALWASAMSCYIYGDYFWLYQPGKLQSMLAGTIVPFGAVTQTNLLGATISMAIPSTMIFLSLALRPGLNRWVNIVLGALYTVFVLMTMRHVWAFYVFLGAVDMLLTAAIVWHAWTWPRLADDRLH